MAGGRAITSDIEQLDRRSPPQRSLLIELAGLLRPIVKLLLKSGVSCGEFIAIAKSVFVQVATEEYGIRGRPTNLSRVAAMTGISRKEVRRVRDTGLATRWTPDMAANPANSVIHYWHYDADFSNPRGEPKSLPFQGEVSFCSLVKRYAGDIPAGAMLKELMRSGTVERTAGGLIEPRKRYFSPTDFDDDFIRGIAFALRHFANTVAHNAEVASQRRLSGGDSTIRGRFERCAWTERLTPVSAAEFQQWVRAEGARFIEIADNWIGEHELPKDQWELHEARAYGVGLYYFEEDRS